MLGKHLVKVTFTVSLESATNPQPGGVSAKDLVGGVTDLLTGSLSGGFNFKKYTWYKWWEIGKSPNTDQLVS